MVEKLGESAMDRGARQAFAHHPSSPVHHPSSPAEKHDFECNKQLQKVNSMMMQWQLGADSVHAVTAFRPSATSV